MSEFIILLYVLSTSVALVVLKLGSKLGAPVELVSGKLNFNITPYTISGILLYGVSFLLYMYLISKYELGYIIPLATAMVYMVIFTASFFIFNEKFTAMKVAGIILIVIGLGILNFKR